MGPITIFLLVMVAGLAMGNAMLYFVGRGGKSYSGQQEGRDAIEKLPANVLEESGLKALNEKLGMAHKRLDKIEKVIMKNSSATYPARLDERLSRMDNFRANTEVELVAIKEILAEIQNQGITVKARKYSRKGKNGQDLSTAEMHKIIYRSD